MGKWVWKSGSNTKCSEILNVALLQPETTRYRSFQWGPPSQGREKCTLLISEPTDMWSWGRAYRNGGSGRATVYKAEPDMLPATAAESRLRDRDERLIPTGIMPTKRSTSLGNRGARWQRSFLGRSAASVDGELFPLIRWRLHTAVHRSAIVADDTPVAQLTTKSIMNNHR